LADQLGRPVHGGLRIAPSTIGRLLRRMGLHTVPVSCQETRWGRVAMLDLHSAQAAGGLTEQTRAQLAAAQRRQVPHIQASQPGDLVCIDTSYSGELKGVGKVWQYTACDAAGSLAVAQVSLGFSAKAAARFLTRRFFPTYQASGWPLQRILADPGSEHRGAFDRACQERDIRHCRTKPRHA